MIWQWCHISLNQIISILNPFPAIKLIKPKTASAKPATIWFVWLILRDGSSLHLTHLYVTRYLIFKTQSSLVLLIFYNAACSTKLGSKRIIILFLISQWHNIKLQTFRVSKTHFWPYCTINCYNAAFHHQTIKWELQNTKVLPHAAQLEAKISTLYCWGE